ncbi:YbhN family protein [Halopenitus sp. H-Gu1]|uniref:lysylphosphatidylglycerol synthase transmembrane domain-containing protein n=1 Tax=Halopenitus sp. H-Gu1 TaxID=3242697 RepID=UPI00359D216C
MSRDESVGAGWIDRRTITKTLLGFAVAILLVYLIGVVVGWERTIQRLRVAKIEWVLLGGLSAIACLAVWAKTWQVVLRAIGIVVPYRKLVVTFLSATFANYVTPMGQAGGEPFIAYILTRDTEATYEESLASVVTTDVIRMLPFFTVGGVGLGYLLGTTQRLPGPVEWFAAVLVALAIGLPLLAVASWGFRDRLRAAIRRLVAPIARRSHRVSLASVDDRIERLYESIEVIAGSPRALLVSVALAYVGWVLFALPLYFSAIAIGTPISVFLVCFLVPVSVVAGSTPLPGGLAAIEGTLVALLTALTVLSTADALAVTTIYRLVSYWFVVGVGGVATLWVIRRN